MLTPYAGPWDRSRAAHLVRRTMFGCTPADLEQALAGSLEQAVDGLLRDTPAPSPPEAYLKTGSVDAGQPWSSASYDANQDNVRTAFLQSWWIDLMLQQGFSMREKMTLFWANHFSTSHLQVKDARYSYKLNALLRSMAFGNVKELVRAVTLDPSMLRYLSGNTNTKSAPNENYGRELQELFTIGKGPEVAPGDYTYYTEDDVKAAARVLTGWSDVQSNVTTKFTANAHDTGDKQFSPRYGNAVIRGGIGESGARRELDDLLSMIFSREATSLHLVRKLYRFFVDYVIAPETERDIIAPLAKMLRDNAWEMRPVLKALLMSDHFYAAERIGCAIKTPADLVIGMIRFFRPADLFPTEARNKHWAYRTVRRTMATMQLDVCNAPNVAGWPAYYQEPVFHEIWINADTLQKRVKFTNDLTKDGLLLDEAYEPSFVDPFAAARQVSDPSDLRTLITEWAFLFFPIPLTSQQIDALIEATLSGVPETVWTYEWNGYEADPSNEEKRTSMETKLRTLLKTMLAMAEYQIC